MHGLRPYHCDAHQVLDVGPDPNVGDAKVTAMSLLMGGMPTAIRGHVENANASLSRSFATSELDTVTSTRCSTTCRGCNTDVLTSTYPKRWLRLHP